MKHIRKSLEGSETTNSSRTDSLRMKGRQGRVKKKKRRRTGSKKQRMRVCVEASRGCPTGSGCGSVQSESESESSANDNSEAVGSCDVNGSSLVAETSSMESSSRLIVAVDCEMVSVANKSALAKCTIIDFEDRVLFDDYVRPEQQIRDYRTKWSGIRPHHMKIALPHREAVRKIKTILEGCVVIGHDLGHDFAAIGMTHPRGNTRDTAKFPPLRELAGLKRNWSPSLRNLALCLLGRQIQCGSHCSLEDARAALDIYRKYAAAWEKHLLDKKFWFHDQFWPEDIAPSN